jgi:division protein CdvB (Snf7/Vps24/ESCRT-III family)
MMCDIAYLVHPIKSVVATVGQQIQHMMPDVSFELSQVNESLESIMVNAGDVTENMAPGGSQSTVTGESSSQFNAMFCASEMSQAGIPASFSLTKVHSANS